LGRIREMILFVLLTFAFLTAQDFLNDYPVCLKTYGADSDGQQITAIKDTNQKEMLTFLSEANDYFSRINPYLIYKNYHYFKPEDIYYVVSLSNLLNANFNYLSNYERLSYFNELVIKLDQIKLGLLYSNLNEAEKKILQESLDFAVDSDDNTKYNQANQGGRR